MDRHLCKAKPNPIRLGILLDNPLQPAWVENLFSRIQRSSYARITQTVLISSSHEAECSVEARSWAWNLFSRMDKTLHRGRVKSHLPTDISGLLVSIPSLSVTPTWTGGVLQISPAELADLHSADLDLILIFSSSPVTAEIARCSRYGALPFFDDIEYWKIPATVLEFLIDLYGSGTKAIRQNPYTVVFPPDRIEQFYQKSTSAALSLTWKVLREKFKRKLASYTRSERWEIACFFNDKSTADFLDFPEFLIRPIAHPSDSISADPFPVCDHGRIFLFFEEMSIREKHPKGHLAVVEIDPEKRSIGKPKTVLSSNYHLSYPFVFNWDGAYYLIPESSQKRTVDLYRCKSFPDQWELCQTLLTDFPALDVTLFQKGDCWWMFASRRVSDEDNEFIDTFEIYYADSPMGPWKPHSKNPINVSSWGVRSAGRVFDFHGNLVRPVQDCSPAYGYAVLFRRIDELTPERFQETEIGCLLPPSSQNVVGLHTFNRIDGFTAIDLKKKASRFFPWRG